MSGSLASAQSFTHGRFEARIRAAAGPGLITGFSLHRGSPRQEIDIEFVGSRPAQMVTNVYFNPGEEGSALEFGYRGTPFWIDLGFKATGSPAPPAFCSSSSNVTTRTLSPTARANETVE